MGKGLCATDRTWLGTLGNLGEKIKGIMSQAANSVTSMFSDATISTDLSNENKTVRRMKMKNDQQFSSSSSSRAVDQPMDRNELFRSFGEQHRG